MTEYKYATYQIGNYVVLDQGKPGEVEIDALTPKQQKAIVAKMVDAIDRELVKALTGGYNVEVNSAGSKGLTIEHVRRPRKIVSDPRQESRKGGAGIDRSCAPIGSAAYPGEG